MRPRHQAFRGGYRTDSLLLQQGCGLAGSDPLVQLLLVGLHLPVEANDVLGDTDRCGPGDAQGQFLLALAPAGDLEDLDRGQLPAGINAEVVAAHQDVKCIHRSGAVLGHGSACCGRDPQALVDPLVQAGTGRYLHRQRQHGHGLPVGVQDVGFADLAVLFGVRARGLGGGEESVSGLGAGEDPTVGCCPLDDPGGICVGVGAPATHAIARSDFFKSSGTKVSWAAVRLRLFRWFPLVG